MVRGRNGEAHGVQAACCREGESPVGQEFVFGGVRLPDSAKVSFRGGGRPHERALTAEHGLVVFNGVSWYRRTEEPPL